MQTLSSARALILPLFVAILYVPTDATISMHVLCSYLLRRKPTASLGFWPARSPQRLLPLMARPLASCSCYLWASMQAPSDRPLSCHAISVDRHGAMGARDARGSGVAAVVLLFEP